MSDVILKLNFMDNFTFENNLYGEIWDWIHELKAKYKHDDIVKIKANMIGLMNYFIDKHPPELVAIGLKALIERGSIISNIDEEGVSPTDAYFLPENYVSSQREKLNKQLKQLDKFEGKIA
jgi:hypothetical protein